MSIEGTELLIPDDTGETMSIQIEQLDVIKTESARFYRKIQEFEKGIQEGNTAACRIAWTRLQRAAVDLRLELSRIQRSRTKIDKG